MKKYCTLLILALIATISCNRVENIFRGDSDKVKIVVNGYEGDDITRSIVKINPDAKANVTFSFENNDLLGVFPDVDYSQQLKLKAVGADKDGKSFSGNTVGWLLNGEKSYAAYYPFNADYHQRPDNIVFSYKGQKQIGNGNTESNLAHLGGYTFLYSKPVKPSDNSVTFGMNNASAFLHIRHFSEEGGTFAKMTISAKDGSKSIPTALKANLFPTGTGAVSDTVAVDSLSTSIAVNLDNYIVEAKQNLNVWCALPPVDLSGETLVFKFFDADGNVADSFEKPGQDLTLKNTGRWKIHNFIEQVYALKYHANAEGATFADGATEYKDIVPATEPSHTFTIIGTDKEPVRSGYKVKGWSTTESGEVEYSSGTSTITINNTEYTTSDATKDLYAVWTEDTTPKYTVTLAADPQEGGSVTFKGEDLTQKTVEENTELTIVAQASSGYSFTGWTWGTDGSSSEAELEITVTGNITYTATFEQQQSQADGSLPGVFSVSATKKVKFSQGNLQYHCKEHIWRFAPNQYDYIGDGGTNCGNVDYGDNTKIADGYNGWIDLFGWCTSGIEPAHSPTLSTGNSADYKVTIDGSKNYYDLTGTLDWGYNTIGFWDKNGDFQLGSEEGKWRTLTSDEWVYLVTPTNTNRTKAYRISTLTISNASYTAYGMFIFPDNWDKDFVSYMTKSESYNNDFTKYGYNNKTTIASSKDECTVEQFIRLINEGVVFLPVTGYRAYSGGATFNKSTDFYYWSSINVISSGSHKAYSYAFTLVKSTGGTKLTENWNGSQNTPVSRGFAVRLVTDVK